MGNTDAALVSSLRKLLSSTGHVGDAFALTRIPSPIQSIIRRRPAVKLARKSHGKID